MTSFTWHRGWLGDGDGDDQDDDDDGFL